MRLYAMLVGINDYGKEVGKLRGAVNDVGHYRDFLQEHFDDQTLELLTLTDADATRENIIAGFRDFLGRATSEDVALFQYAGHGARWRSAPVPRRGQPTRRQSAPRLHLRHDLQRRRRRSPRQTFHRRGPKPKRLRFLTAC